MPRKDELMPNPTMSKKREVSLGAACLSTPRLTGTLIETQKQVLKAPACSIDSWREKRKHKEKKKRERKGNTKKKEKKKIVEEGEHFEGSVLCCQMLSQ